MVSIVDIANLALTSLGADRIISLTENSEGARKINAIYEILRDEVLRSAPWKFAIRWATLAQLNETILSGYTYVFQLPVDCLRVLRLRDRDVDFRIENNKLYCNESSVTIRYITRVEDTSQYDSAFVSAFATRLAAELAYPITSSLSVRDGKWEEYKLKIEQAEAIDSQEDKADYKDTSSWKSERNGGEQVIEFVT